MDNFDKAKEAKKTCKDCGYAIYYANLGNVVCGVWHTTLTSKSLCDNFQTPEQVKEANRKAGEALKKRIAEKFKP